MTSFEEYIEKANSAKNTKELFEVFLSSVNYFGFDRVHFGLLTNHNDIGLPASIGIVQNYPQDWMKYYNENHFERIDPIIKYGIHQPGAFRWSDLNDKLPLKPQQKNFMQLAVDAGLNNGVSVPLRGSKGQIAGISLATSEKLDAYYLNNDLITAYCNHFYAAYKRINKKKSDDTTFSEPIILTNKEKDILQWASVGKSDEEIAMILNISKHTVNMHLRSIYAKMNVNNRILAVVKAISLGLVQI